jgi:UDPglucose 6-dehydrogenase
MDDYKVIIDKSTVPVGTADKVKVAVKEQLDARKSSLDFDVVSNPEFLKEGAAITDFMKPDRIVIGVDNEKTEDLMRSLYAPFNRNHDRLIAMDIRSAELTKYAANAMLATKISFMNELSHIAERTGANIEHVRIGIGADSRIGYHFIYAGPGYGGSCFPKDVNALVRTAHDFGYEAKLLESVEKVNYHQKQVLFEKIKHHFNGDLKGKTIALWGLSFKPNTDDMREAPSRVLMEKLWEEGAIVKAHDPKAMEETTRIYGQRDDLVLCDSPDDVLEDADVLVLMTEWHIFQSPDFDFIKSKLKQPVIFDGRNIYQQETMDDYGFTYYAIGRGKQVYIKE